MIVFMMLNDFKYKNPGYSCIRNIRYFYLMDYMGLWRTNRFKGCYDCMMISQIGKCIS